MAGHQDGINDAGVARTSEQPAVYFALQQGCAPLIEVPGGLYERHRNYR